jgi:hypothetical protein
MARFSWLRQEWPIPSDKSLIEHCANPRKTLPEIVDEGMLEPFTEARAKEILRCYCESWPPPEGAVDRERGLRGWKNKKSYGEHRTKLSRAIDLARRLAEAAEKKEADLETAFSQCSQSQSHSPRTQSLSSPGARAPSVEAQTPDAAGSCADAKVRARDRRQRSGVTAVRNGVTQNTDEVLRPGEEIFFWDKVFTNRGDPRSQVYTRVLAIRVAFHPDGDRIVKLRLANGALLDQTDRICRFRDAAGKRVVRDRSGNGLMRSVGDWKVEEGEAEDLQSDAQRLGAEITSTLSALAKKHKAFGAAVCTGKRPRDGQRASSGPSPKSDGPAGVGDDQEDDARRKKKASRAAKMTARNISRKTKKKQRGMESFFKRKSQPLKATNAH